MKNRKTQKEELMETLLANLKYLTEGQIRTVLRIVWAMIWSGK